MYSHGCRQRGRALGGIVSRRKKQVTFNPKSAANSTNSWRSGRNFRGGRAQGHRNFVHGNRVHDVNVAEPQLAGQAEDVSHFVEILFADHHVHSNVQCPATLLLGLKQKRLDRLLPLAQSLLQAEDSQTFLSVNRRRKY